VISEKVFVPTNKIQTKETYWSIFSLTPKSVAFMQARTSLVFGFKFFRRRRKEVSNNPGNNLGDL
jgi:hypothetical protein